ncbi:MAG: lipopolysaccharide heptosyltransferase II [bacterium]
MVIAAEQERLLICSPNWVGDAIMSMPALQAFRRAAPGAEITMLTKPALAPLWQMHGAIDRVEVFEESPAGTFRAGALLRAIGYRRAFLFSNSFRSALIPYLGRVPERIGAAGHWRRAMLTGLVHYHLSSLRRHQTFEYFDILGLETAGFDAPRLSLPVEAVSGAAEKVGTAPARRVGVLPGAARGPSKRWPVEYFAAVAQRLAREQSAHVVVFGSGAENDTCRAVAGWAGDHAINLAGRTTLPEWAAALKLCDLVICNDSGGMHLAAAVGTPVLAVYGLTDPARTGPLGTRRRIIQDSMVRSRDIARRSDAAQKCLAAIEPNRVYEAALECLDVFRRNSSAA